MPVSLEYIGDVLVGDGLAPNPQSAGGITTDLVITRRAKVKNVDAASYVRQIIGATGSGITKDPYFDGSGSPAKGTAYLVNQRITAKDKADGTLTLVFAMVPTTWSDYEEIDYLFPAFTGLNVAGLEGIASSRTTQLYLPVTARVQHDYFFTPDARTIARPALFQPVDVTNLATNSLSTTTIPSNDTYEYYCAAKQELVARVRVRRWMGDIFERLTYYVPAS